mmetsp:Transcript_5802/g.13423  ORF Transcript_5802/g.13423 Transcript_5802/m.13423 type:complete len:340 (-) Transcript_5802:201-1220(-)
MATLSPPTLEADLVVDAKAHLGEGPIWHEGRAELLFLDILNAKVMAYSPERGETTLDLDLSSVTANITTIVPVEGSNSRVVVGTTDGIALLDLDQGVLASWEPHPSSGKLHGEFVRMNDGKCDPQGRLWIGSISRVGPGGADLAPGGASLYRLDGWATEPARVLGGITVSNGLAWTADGKTMLYTDSPTFGVDSFDFDPSSGDISNRRRAVTCAEGFPPVPDGCCLDSEGKLWVACFGAGEVRRYDPNSSELLAVVKLPEAAGPECTAVAFGGPDLADLYITSAHEFWGEEKLAEMPLAGGLFRVPAELLSTVTGSCVSGVRANAFNVNRVGPERPSAT